jgi:hypothetical protein
LKRVHIAHFRDFGRAIDPPSDGRNMIQINCGSANLSLPTSLRNTGLRHAHHPALSWIWISKKESAKHNWNRATLQLKARHVSGKCCGNVRFEAEGVLSVLKLHSYSDMLCVCAPRVPHTRRTVGKLQILPRRTTIKTTSPFQGNYKKPRKIP